MRPLSLEESFPDQMTLAPATGPLMPAWAGLLASSVQEAGASIADLLGLTPRSSLTLRVARVALLVPRAPDRRDSIRHRSLAVEWREGGHLLFRGNEHWLPFDWPPDFRGPLARLGLVSFTGQDEVFVDSGPEAAAISQRLSEAGERPQARLRPFYTDGGDRTSLWMDEDTSRSWVFDRALGRLSPESEGGFHGWFTLHLAACGPG